MAFIPNTFITELIESIRLSDFLGTRLKLTRKGNSHWACCPFHGEKTPSFSINDDKNFYHCFGCGEHGNALNYLTGYERLPFVEAVEELAQYIGKEVPKTEKFVNQKEKKKQLTLYDLMEHACRFYQQALHKPMGSAGLNYFKNRQLTTDTISQFRLGFSPTGGKLVSHLKTKGFKISQMIEAGLVIKSTQKGKSDYERFRNRVMFPIHNKKGQVIAFGGRVLDDSNPKYLNSPETSLFHKSTNLYALNLASLNARKTNTLIICEGYMDVIALFQAGFNYAVAPMGTALTEEQIKMTWQYASSPILCFDGDSAGVKASLRSAIRALPLLKTGKGISFLTLPKGEDPDTLIKSKGSKKFQELVSQSLPISQYIWHVETQQGIPDTVEAQAQLENKLLSYVNDIEDPSLKKYLYNEYTTKLWQAVKSSYYNKNTYHKSKQTNSNNRYNNRYNDDIIQQISTPDRSENNVGIRSLILLCALVRFPYLFYKFEEQLFQIPSFNEQNIENLKNGLVDIISKHDIPVNYESMLELLKENSIYDLFTTIFTNSLIMHAPWLAIGNTTEQIQIEKLWKKIFMHYEKQQLELSIAQAKSQYLTSETPEDYQLFINLKTKLETLKEESHIIEDDD